MKVQNRVLVVMVGVLSLALACSSAAQSPSDWIPVRSAILNLDNVAVARASTQNGEVMIDLLIPQFKDDLTGMKEYDRFAISLRTENGKVQKEVTEVTHTKNIEDGTLDMMVRCSVPLNSVHAFKIDGSTVDATELKNSLSKPRHVFLYKGNEHVAKQFVNGIERFHSSLIRQDAVFLFVEYETFIGAKKSIIENPGTKSK